MPDRNKENIGIVGRGRTMRIVFGWDNAVSREYWLQKKDVFTYLIHNLAKEGHEMFCVCRGNLEIFRLCDYGGDVCYCLVPDPKSYIESLQPDIFVLTGLNENPLIQSLRHLKCRKIIQDAGGGYFAIDNSGYDAVVIEREYQRSQVPNNRGIVIPCGADTKLFKPENLEKKWDVVCIANNFLVKRINELMEITQQMGLKLLILGSGYSLNNPNIYAVRLPNSEMPKYINQCKVFALLSTYKDTGPRAVSEAMSCGLPVVCFEDSLGIRSLAEAAGCGVVCNPNNIKEKLSELLNNEENIKELGRRAREYAVKQLDYEVCYKQWKELMFND